MCWCKESRDNTVHYSDLVVEEADGEDVLVLRHPVSHGQVSQRVSQQQHVGSTLQLSEASCTGQSPFPLVEGVDQFAFEGSQDPLINKTMFS